MSSPVLQTAPVRNIGRLTFLGFPVDCVTMADAVERVIQYSREPVCRQVAVLNANKLWLASRDPQLTEVLHTAELVVGEYAVAWGMKKLGNPLPQSIVGSRLVEALLPELCKRKLRVFFLGARDDVLARMLVRLTRSLPGLVVAGARSGYFGPADEEAVIDEINAAKPAVLFVCMGSPRQELWIHRTRSRLSAGVAMGAGGTFDVLSGDKKDAPPWTRHGLEWAFRLSQDPANLWKRYLITNPWIVWRVLRARFNRNP